MDVDHSDCDEKRFSEKPRNISGRSSKKCAESTENIKSLNLDEDIEIFACDDDDDDENTMVCVNCGRNTCLPLPSKRNGV